MEDTHVKKASAALVVAVALTTAEEKAGKKVVTSLEITEGPQSDGTK